MKLLCHIGRVNLKMPIYADYNSTTPMCTPAKEAMVKVLEVWGNPSSSHQIGRNANRWLQEAREKVARATGVSEHAVVFTSGGSEANTLAIMGSFFHNARPFRLITTGVEHSSVRDTCKLLQSLGGSTLSVAVNREGELDLAAFADLVERAEPNLVSIMVANNETGVIFPIPKIIDICRKVDVALHVDAVQAFGKVPTSFFLGADFISVSSHKIYGPKGIGALLLPTGKQLVSTHYGGAQEIKRRGGTENMLGAVAFGAAAALLSEPPQLSDLESLRDRFEETLLTELPEITIQGSKASRLPNTSNVRFIGIANEILLSAFDLDGLCVSAGSACSSGSISPSPVLLAMGLDPVEAKECVRFSWGRESTVDAVDMAAELVINHVKRIRSRRKATS